MYPRTSRKLLGLLATAIGVSVPLVGAATPANAAGSVTLTRSVTSDWGSGFCADVKVTTSSTTSVTWSESFDAQGAISSIWNARSNGNSNPYTVTGEAWNSTVSAASPTTFGYCANRTASSPAPTASPTTTVTASPTPTASITPTPTPTATATVPPTAKDFSVAPYVDMAGWPVPDLAGMSTASGIKAYSLAFITSAGNCTPAWGGIAGLAPTATGDQITSMNKSIADFTAGGGKVLVSFGGANGSELAQTCTDTAALAKAYQSVVDKYNLTRIDFDVEGGAQGDHAANQRRAAALVKVQDARIAAGKTPLTISFTLPVLPSGLTADGLGVLTDSQKAGIVPSLVNIMAMDYGGPNSAMGQAAIDATTNTAGQLAPFYPGTTAAQRIARVGITPMIGENDVPQEVFTVSDAQKVTTWAAANSAGMIGWWSVTRDKPCPNNGTYASPTCSGTTNPEWAYAKAFLQLPAPTATTTASPTPTVTPSPTPTSTQTGAAAVSIRTTTTDNWGSGRTVDVTVTNTGTAPINAWQIAFPWNVTVKSMWNANNLSTSGTVKAGNASWNGSIPVGSSATFGMTVATPTAPGAITSCTAVVNQANVTCAVK